MPGYVVIDKNRTARPDDIVAILAERSGKNRSKIILKKGTCYSRTSPKKLAERLKSSNEKKGFFKRAAPGT